MGKIIRNNPQIREKEKFVENFDAQSHRRKRNITQTSTTAYSLPEKSKNMDGHDISSIPGGW